MSAEANKELVTQTWKSFVKGDLSAVFANMSDEITWFIPGDIPNLSGLRKGKAEVVNFARQAAKMFPNGLTSEILRTYADGDTVILEMINRGKFAGGGDYLNEYCFIFEVEAGKIRRVREYVDTKRVTDLRAKAGLD